MEGALTPPLQTLILLRDKIMSAKIITHNQLKSFLNYCPDSGLFSWKINGKRNKNGEVAGSSHIRGYITIGIMGRQYLAHRLAWLYVTGEWPKKHIDHINRDRSDNRFLNLREACHIVNSRNRKPSKNSLSGVTGVSWRKKDKKWQARINNDEGIQINLGYFANLDDAIVARKKAEIEYSHYIS